MNPEPGPIVNRDAVNLSLHALAVSMNLLRATSSKQLLIVANFNGLLEQEKRRTNAEPQLEELFRHASRDGSMVMWIEPRMNEAIGVGGLFEWIRKWAAERLSHFARIKVKEGSATPFAVTECQYRSPFAPITLHNVRLAVVRLDLGRFS